MQHVRKSGAKPCNYYVSDTFYSLMSVTFLRVSDLLWLLLLLFCTCFPDFPWLSQAEFDLSLLLHPKINHARTSQYYQVELLQTDRTAASRIWMGNNNEANFFSVISHGLLLTCLIFFYLLSDSMLSAVRIVYIFITFPLQKFPFTATRKIQLACHPAVPSLSRRAF